MITLINKEYFDIETRKDEKGEGYVTTFTIPSGIGREKASKSLVKVSSEIAEWETNTPTRVFSGNPKYILSVSQSNKNPYDEPVVIMAIPYNGIIEPIGKSYEYRIHRAYIAQAERGSNSKVAYFVLSFNSTLFKPDNKNHKDVLTFTFVNYFRRYNVDENGEKKSVSIKRSVTITMNAANEHTFNETEEEVVVDVSEFKGRKPFYIFMPKQNNGKWQERKPEPKPYVPSILEPSEDPIIDGTRRKPRPIHSKKEREDGPKNTSYKLTKQERQKRGFEKTLETPRRNISTTENAWGKSSNEESNSKSKPQYKAEDLTTPVIPKGMTLEKMIEKYNKENADRQKSLAAHKKGKKRRKNR